MNKIMKVCSVFCLFFMLSMLAACGGSDEDAASSGEQNAQTNSENKEVDTSELISQGKAIDGMSFEYDATVPGSPVIHAKVATKGKNMRTEMASPDGNGNIITIINGEQGVAYMYQPEQNMATQIDISSIETESYSPQDSLEAVDPGDMVYADKETIDGKTCLVYEYKYGVDNSTGKMWIWEEYGLPLKVEYTQGEQELTVEYSNVQVGNIPDSTFELPEGVQVMDLNVPNFDGNIPNING